MTRLSHIAIIAKKEFRQYLRDRRLYLAGGLIFFLFSSASFMGRHVSQQASATERAFSSDERERWLNQADGMPHSAAHHGVYLIRPQPASQAMEPGVSLWTGAVVFLEAHNRNLFRFPPARDLGQSRRLGELSLAALLEAGVCLLVVLLAYDAIAAERESGTLRLMMAQSVSPGSIAAGKFMGTLGALAVALAPALACATAVFWGAVPWNTTVLLAATYGAYLLQVLAIVLTISSLARTSKVALFGGLTFWLWNCTVVPQAAITIVSLQWPTPNPLELQAAIIEEQSIHPTLWDRREAINRRYLDKYGVSSLLDLPVNPDGILLLEQEAYDTRATGRSVKRLYDIHRQQDRSYRWAALAAPSVGTQSLSRAIAGTDLNQFHEFADAAEEYRQRMVRLMNETTAYDSSIRTGTIHSRAEVMNVKAGKDLWGRLPRFQYLPGDLRARLTENCWMIAASILWSVASGAVLAVAVQRVQRFAA